MGIVDRWIGGGGGGIRCVWALCEGKSWIGGSSTVGDGRLYALMISHAPQSSRRGRCGAVRCGAVRCGGGGPGGGARAPAQTCTHVGRVYASQTCTHVYASR